MITARGISKSFTNVQRDGRRDGGQALLSASLSLPAGSFTALVGPTGCGKSTFLEILAGLQLPSEGEVHIDGRLVVQPPPTERRALAAYQRRHRFLPPTSNGLWSDQQRHDIAMIFQDYAIFPWMTALENLTFTLKLRGVPRGERAAIARRHLERVGLRGAETKYPAQLSGGMRQRLAIARALSVEPRIILMDEPFAAVDPLTREHLQEELLRLWRETGTTIVLVTHDFQEAVYLADRVAIFSHQPGTIRNHIPVDLPRPRRRDDPALRELRERIVSIYQHDTLGEADYII